jgi:DNA-binding transcriptional MerR regulator
MSQNKILDIGEVAKASGLPASTLRFYEERGLIRSVGRKGLRRLFAASVVLRLALITLGRNAHFSLSEIGVMLIQEGTRIDRNRLAKKADELSQKIKYLTEVRDGLRHASKCKAPTHLECPKFQRLLRLAARSGKQHGAHQP